MDLAAGEVDSQLKSVDNGGLAKGVFLETPKCCSLRWKRRVLIVVGSVIVVHDLDCLGGRLSSGMSNVVTRDRMLGLMMYLILR